MFYTASACDGCGSSEYSSVNPYVEIRTSRPSDPSDLVCVLAGCASCFPGEKTPEEWETYFDSGDAARDGFAWLT